jgi:hypothetical protein
MQYAPFHARGVFASKKPPRAARMMGRSGGADLQTQIQTYIIFVNFLRNNLRRSEFFDIIPLTLFLWGLHLAAWYKPRPRSKKKEEWNNHAKISSGAAFRSRHCVYPSCCGSGFFPVQ